MVFLEFISRLRFLCFSRVFTKHHSICPKMPHHVVTWWVPFWANRVVFREKYYIAKRRSRPCVFPKRPLYLPQNVPPKAPQKLSQNDPKSSKTAQASPRAPNASICFKLFINFLLNFLISPHILFIFYYCLLFDQHIFQFLPIS